MIVPFVEFQVQLSYAIGVAEPLSIFCDSYGTVKEGYTDDDLTRIIVKNFDLRPGSFRFPFLLFVFPFPCRLRIAADLRLPSSRAGVIVQELKLQTVKYLPTAC